jgi:hypothetical protein
MCDQSEQTIVIMRQSLPSLFIFKGELSLAASIKQIKQLAKCLEQHLKLCGSCGLNEIMVYALLLLEKGFKSNCFVHSATAPR